MSMTTRAAVCREPDQPSEITELEVDDPRANEVRITFYAAGMCHSDDHIQKGDAPMRIPVVGGHEDTGVVDAVGDGVTRVKVGDHVSEYSVIPIPKEIPFEVAALLGCAVPTGWRIDSDLLVDGVQLIGGDWVPSSSGQTIDVINPANRTLLARIPRGNADDVEAGVQAAEKAFPAWRDMNATARGRLLFQWADLIEEAMPAGDQYGDGCVIQPTLFDKVDPSMRIAREEIFGPVLSVIAVDEEQEAVAVANGIEYGLAHDGQGRQGDDHRRRRAQGEGGPRARRSADRLPASDPRCTVRGLQPAVRHSETPRARPLGRPQAQDLVTRTHALDDVNEAYQDLADGKNIRGVIVHDI